MDGETTVKEGFEQNREKEKGLGEKMQGIR
jgi:hypothetical protein